MSILLILLSLRHSHVDQIQEKDSPAIFDQWYESEESTRPQTRSLYQLQYDAQSGSCWSISQWPTTLVGPWAQNNIKYLYENNTEEHLRGPHTTWACIQHHRLLLVLPCKLPRGVCNLLEHLPIMHCTLECRMMCTCGTLGRSKTCSIGDCKGWRGILEKIWPK